MEIFQSDQCILCLRCRIPFFRMSFFLGRLNTSWMALSSVGCGGFDLGSTYSLSLIPHVALLRLLRLWKILVDIFDVDKRPSLVVAIVYALEPRRLRWKSCRCVMYISDCLLNARQVVHVVDGFLEER